MKQNKEFCRKIKNKTENWIILVKKWIIVTRSSAWINVWGKDKKMTQMIYNYKFLLELLRNVFCHKFSSCRFFVFPSFTFSKLFCLVLEVTLFAYKQSPGLIRHVVLPFSTHPQVDAWYRQMLNRTAMTISSCVYVTLQSKKTIKNTFKLKTKTTSFHTIWLKLAVSIIYY